MGTSSAPSWWPWPTWSLALVLLLAFLPDTNDSKKVRINYKLRVGNDKEIGRYSDYSGVGIPPTGKFRDEDAERYYRHPKVTKSTVGSRFNNKYLLNNFFLKADTIGNVSYGSQYTVHLDLTIYYRES